MEPLAYLSEKPYNVGVNDELNITAIGKRLAELRASAGLSLRQAAERAERLGGDISHTQIGDMEKGRIKGLSLPKIRTLAAVYGVSLEDILGVDRPITARDQQPGWDDEDPLVREIHIQTLAISRHGRLSKTALEMLLASAQSVREQVDRQVEGERKRVRKPKSSRPQPPPTSNSEDRDTRVPS